MNLHLKRLKTADRAAIPLSIVSLVLAGLTHNSTFAIAGLSVTLILGLLRREQLEREIELAEKKYRTIDGRTLTIESSRDREFKLIEDKLNLLENSQNFSQDSSFIKIKQELSEARESLRSLWLSISELIDLLKSRDIDYQAQVADLTKNISRIEQSSTMIDRDIDNKLKILFLSQGKEFELIENKLNLLLTNEPSIISSIINLEQSASKITKDFIGLDSLVKKLWSALDIQGINYFNKVTEIEHLLADRVSKINKVTAQFDHVYFTLDKRINKIENATSSIESMLSTQSLKKMIDASMHSQLMIIENVFLEKISQKDLILVFGRKESRKYFLESLRTAKERLILVCPWLRRYALDEREAQELIVSALKRNVRIDIGWGHLSDVTYPLPLSRENLKLGTGEKDPYNAVEWLTALEKEYKNLTLTLLGTHEKYLVCDRNFAMIGSHNFMTSGSSSKERELGILTKDITTINKLIKIYDQISGRKENLNEVKVYNSAQKIADIIAPIAFGISLMQQSMIYTTEDGIKIEADREAGKLKIFNAEGKTYLVVNIKRNDRDKPIYITQTADLPFPDELVDRFVKLQERMQAAPCLTTLRTL
jgi:hypothetical protein